ncbi:MAG: hypothetical protein K0R28_1125 [Paenibacillus sp.]|nr:hypothetical protein [Paenibacillus sp.]
MIRKMLLKNGLICCLGILLCLASVLGPVPISLASESGITIDNPGFEQTAEGGTIPGWRQTYGVGVTAVTYGVTDTAKHSGNYSLRLNDTSTSATLGIESDKIPIKGGTAYSASAMFLVEREKLSIYLQFFNQSGTRISNLAASLDPTGGAWVKGSVSGIAPAEAVTASVLLYSASTVRGAGYIDDVKVEVNPIGTFEHLGQPIMNFIHQDSAIGHEQGRHVSYTVVKGADDGTVFAVVDILDAKVIKTIPMPGVTGAWAVKQASDGKIYVGTHYDGRLYQYSPGSDSLVDLGRLGQETHVWAISAGPSGKVYAGTYPNAHVYEYDPATNRVNDLGRVHPTEKYVRSLAYDPDRNVLYAGVGGVSAAIIKLDLNTGSQEDILPKLLPQTYSGYGFASSMGYALGKLFVKVSKPDHLLIVDTAAETLEFLDDPSAPISMGPSIVTMPGDNSKIYFNGYILRSYDINTRTFDVEYPDPAMRWVAFQQAKFIQLNDPEWPGYTLAAAAEKGKFMLYNMQTGKIVQSKVDNFGSPVLIQSVNAGFDGNIYMGGYLGATGFTSYRPADGTFTDIQEFGQVESVSSVNNKLYIGTYGNSRIHEYDPTAPWSGTNPRRVAELIKDGQDRPFALLGVDSLNKLYIGSVADYGTHQGALSVYDPVTRKTQVFKNMAHNQGVVSLVYQDGFVYGGTTIYGGLGTSAPTEKEGKLFVFDTATNTKVLEIVPVPGRRVVSGLLAGPDGMIWGVAEDTIFKFDPNTRQVVYKAAKLSRYGSGTVWVDAFLELGTDGNVYGTNRQKTFFMIKPETMDFIPIKNGAGNYLTQDLYGNLYMSNDADLWKYILPTDEKKIADFATKAAAAGHIPAPIHDQLTNSLNQAVHQREIGHQEQAIKHLQDFLKHLHNEAFASSIVPEVKWPLDQQARTLIAAWSSPED